MQKTKSRIQLPNLLILIISYLFVSLLIYFTKGVTLYWHLYAIPLVIAAFTYDVAGGLVVGLLDAAAISGWLFYFNHYLVSSMSETMNFRIVEITIGLLLYIGIGTALGYLAQSQKQQKALLEGLSIQDRLTGLFNYSYFVDKLSDEKIRSDRYGNIFSLIMFDIDFFKNLNDTYGHEAGNKVLQRIAEVISKKVRNVDIVSRYGGEEFAVLLPYAAGSDAQLVAERIREVISEEEFHFLQSDKKNEDEQNVTISGGIATYPTDAGNETELIINADRALYKAKATGRNKVCVFSKSDIKRDQKLIKH
jgi:diguanylate cyclase (GGDEF)-like protein